MALREEAVGTVGSRIFDVMEWAGVKGKEMALELDVAESFVSRLRGQPDSRISVGVVNAVAQYCAGRRMLSHVEWTTIRSFVLDGGTLPGPEYLLPSEAPSGGGGRVIPLKGDASNDTLYSRDSASDQEFRDLRETG